MDIKLKWDQSQLDQFIGQVPRRLAYATVNAINLTAKRIQQDEFARARSVFQIRKQQFFFGSDSRVGGVAARITQFASVGKAVPFAEITAGKLPGGGDGGTGFSRLLYGRFEAGGTREPFTPGAKSVAVPILGRPARPSIAAGVPPAFTFSGLKFREYWDGQKLTKGNRWTKKGTGSGLLAEYGRLQIPGREKGVQWKGLQRTFIAFTAAHPRGAVFQRFGPGKDGIRIIWVFEAPFPIDTRLQFVATAQATAATYFVQECAKQVQLVLDHDNEKFVLQALREL